MAGDQLANPYSSREMHDTLGEDRFMHAQFLTKRAFAVSVVRRMITTGELKPGDHLRQDELSERLHVSSTPMREALLLLQAEGLLSYSPHKGVRVHQFTPAEELEAYRIRVALEPLAVRLAVPHMTERDLQRLSETNQSMAELAREERWDDYIRLNRAFHQIYVEVANSPLLDDLISRVWARAPWHIIPVSPRRGTEIGREHARLVQATLARDAELAAHFMEEHIGHTVLYAREGMLDRTVAAAPAALAPTENGAAVEAAMDEAPRGDGGVGWP
jgi:DNA-binding GntR family transcriptional regulator